MQSECIPSFWQRWQVRLQVLCTPSVIRKACLAAVVVGSSLIIVNQGDVLFSGQITRRVLLRSLLTPVIPFCVTMLSVMLNSGTSRRVEELRPGWAAIRRSSLMAVGVGSGILLLNQGHLLFTGHLSLRVWAKILITLCIPFCVSLYGAYVAYWQAMKRL